MADDTPKPGKVRGDLKGVNPKIVTVLTEVAAHYGKDIRVTSGKRDAKDQARAMWNNWTGNLKRGKIYSYLKGSGKADRLALDKFYNDKDRAEFDKLVIKIASKLSIHLKGEAVDIAPKTSLTGPMRKTLQRYLRLLVEKTCYHFDTRGKSPPATITEAMKAKWD